MQRINTIPLFTINIHRVHIPEWKKEGNHILSMVPFDNVKAKDTHLTYTDYFEESEPAYAKDFLEIVQPYLEEFHKVAKYKFTRVTSIWCQKYKSRDYHVPHDHGSTGYSCVFYARMNANVHKSTLFFSPFPAEEGSRESSSIAVDEGDLVIFPSGLMHMAPPHDSNQERVIISLNLI